MSLISDGYREQLRQLHEGKWGDEGHLWLPDVQRMVKLTGATSILDYGCGKGMLRKALGDVVREYDPAIPGKDSAPEPADMLVSTDVLEHVEPERLDEVLMHMRVLTKRAAFIVVATKRARAVLPDGRNAHLIVETPGWWTNTLGMHWWGAKMYERKSKLLMEWVR